MQSLDQVRRLSGGPALLTPAEVGAIFRVDAKTVTRWAQQGKITAVRTLGGHRRYPETEVHRLLNESREARKERG